MSHAPSCNSPQPVLFHPHPARARYAAANDHGLSQMALAFRYRHGVSTAVDEDLALGLYMAASNRALGDQNRDGGDHHKYVPQAVRCPHTVGGFCILGFRGDRERVA